MSQALVVRVMCYASPSCHFLETMPRIPGKPVWQAWNSGCECSATEHATFETAF